MSILDPKIEKELDGLSRYSHDSFLNRLALYISNAVGQTPFDSCPEIVTYLLKKAGKDRGAVFSKALSRRVHEASLKKCLTIIERQEAIEDYQKKQGIPTFPEDSGGEGGGGKWLILAIGLTGLGIGMVFLIKKMKS